MGGRGDVRNRGGEGGRWERFGLALQQEEGREQNQQNERCQYGKERRRRRNRTRESSNATRREWRREEGREKTDVSKGLEMIVYNMWRHDASIR